MTGFNFGRRPRGNAQAEPFPLWRRNRAQWELVNLSATSMAETIPSPAPTGGALNRIEAWNGIAVIGTDVYLAGVGGHNDWWGNEGYKIPLGVDVPGAPILLRAPTPAAYYTTDQSYYLEEPDGKRRVTSSHTYYALHGDALRNKVWRIGIGSGSGTGNHITPDVDAFDLAENDWDAQDSHTDVPEGINNGLSQCQHPTTGDLYVVGATKLWRWNRADTTWTEQTANMPPSANGTFAAARASCVDTLRNRLVVLGNSYATPAGAAYLSLSSTGASWTAATLTGSYANEVAAQAGNTAHYDAALDKYLVKTNTAGNRFVLVDPVDFSTSLLSTTGGDSMPATVNGVFGLFQPMPALSGYVIIPRGDSGVWFLCATAS